MSYHDCGTIVPYPEETICGKFLGGNKHMIVVKRGVEVDTQDQASVQDAIDAGDAMAIKRISWTLNAPSPIDATQLIACEPNAPINYNWTANIIDAKTSNDHIESWDSIDGTTGFVAGVVIVYNCSQNKQWVIDAATVFAGGPQSGSDEEEEFFDIEMRWKSPNKPSKEAANTIFNTAFFTQG